MSNLQSWALNWFNQQRTTHLTEDVTIVHKSGSASVKASVIEPDSAVNAQGIRVRTNTYRFIFTYADVSDIVFTRGTKFIRVSKSQMYEVVTEKDTPEYFNDPNDNELVVTAKKCS